VGLVGVCGRVGFFCVVPAAALPAALHGSHTAAYFVRVPLEVLPGGRSGRLLGLRTAGCVPELRGQARLADPAGQAVEQARGLRLLRGR
jgi:hypothetical protein